MVIAFSAAALAFSFGTIIQGPPPPTNVPGGPDGTALEVAFKASFAGADCEVAAGPGDEKVVVVSNAGVRLWDKDGDDWVDVATALDGGLFTRQCGAGEFVNIIDPDVIYDQRAQRFIIVAIERDGCEALCHFHNCDFFQCGCVDPKEPCPILCNRLHVAMSTSSNPVDFSTGGNDPSWTVTVYDLKDEPLDDSLLGPGHFLNISTDEDYLFVCITDSFTTDETEWRNTVVIINKCLLGNGNCAFEPPAFVRLEDSGYETFGHGLGVEPTGDSNGDPMFAVAPFEPPTSLIPDDQQTHLVISAIFKQSSSWTFDWTTVELPSGARFFNTDGEAAAPGDDHEVGLTYSACVHAVHTGEGSTGRLWAVLHCRETSTSTEEILLWFEIDLDEWPSSGTPFVAQWGKIDKSAQGWECHDPSIAVNESQNVAVTWTQSGPDPGQFMAM